MFAAEGELVLHVLLCPSYFVWCIKHICAVTHNTKPIYLLAVLADVRVDLIESAEHVELR